MGTISLSLPSDGQTVDAADVNTPFNTIAAEFNGNIDNDNIKSSAAISGTKLGALTTPLSVLDANGRGGWIAGVLAAPNTVTNNGNRSYDVVFNSTDYTDELSAGMRLKLTRTVTAPTQCADLESGSSQYFSKTTPAGLTFTDDFTMMGWVKLESYVAGGIIARRNADTEGWSLSVNASGQLTAISCRIAANNSNTNSYQSLPLNKWVHVAATVDLSGTSTLLYIDGVLVPSLTQINGTITAIVQGTTALVVGAEKSAGTNPFDGKIAQAAVFSAVLSAATIRSYMSQGLSGSETSLVSAYSLSNSLNDLSANANNLTANGGALATATDTPFTQTMTGVTTGTTNYGIITAASFSTNTTLTVQVPEGDTIPTSGGVSAVSYAVSGTPYGLPKQQDKWSVECWNLADNNSTANTTFNHNLTLTVPIGAWDLGFQYDIAMSNGSTAPTGRIGISTSNSSLANREFVAKLSQSTANTTVSANMTIFNPVTLTSATPYYTVSVSGNAGTSQLIQNATNATASVVRAKCAYV